MRFLYRKMNKQNLKKAFTLVELVIAIAVFSIFSLGAVSVIVPISNLYTESLKVSDAKLMAFDIAAAIENELAFAVEDEQFPLLISDGAGAGEGNQLAFMGKYYQTYFSTSPGGALEENYLYISRGKEAAEYELFYDVKYYKNNHVIVYFSEGGEDVISMRIEIMDGRDRLLYSLNRNIVPLALYAARS